MHVYHGSKHKFEQFDKNTIGTNGTSEGKGFYFTDNLKIAEGYGEEGYVYTVEFLGRKPLHDKELTLTESEVKRFLLALDKEFEYLSNWGETAYEGLESVLRTAVDGEMNADSDVDLVSGMCNACGNVGRALEVVYETLGYDSIVSEADWGNQTLYIALIPDVVEILSVESVNKKNEKRGGE